MCTCALRLLCAISAIFFTHAQVSAQPSDVGQLISSKKLEDKVLIPVHLETSLSELKQRPKELNLHSILTPYANDRTLVKAVVNLLGASGEMSSDLSVSVRLLNSGLFDDLIARDYSERLPNFLYTGFNRGGFKFFQQGGDAPMREDLWRALHDATGEEGDSAFARAREGGEVVALDTSGKVYRVTKEFSISRLPEKVGLDGVAFLGDGVYTSITTISQSLASFAPPATTSSFELKQATSSSYTFSLKREGDDPRGESIQYYVAVGIQSGPRIQSDESMFEIAAVIPIQVTVEVETEQCSDGVDNDRDGAVDCSDSDCADTPPCPTPPPSEDCYNGVEDDGDGSSDCTDADCSWLTSCSPPVEVCDNGSDDDGDWMSDCGDSDCNWSPNCIVQPEICTDGSDNDGDGATDCSDTDCFYTTTCTACSAECPYGGGSCNCYNSWGGWGTCTCDCGGCLQPPAAPEIVNISDGESFALACWSWDMTLSVQGRLSGYGDVAVYVNGGYRASLGWVGGDFSVPLSLPRGTHHISLVLQSTGASVSRTVTVYDPCVSEICGDGSDNDLDGLTDCSDNECSGYWACYSMPEQCSNGWDDDNDGYADCSDSDCSTTSSCINHGETCSDGFDNDSDGYIDCQDSDCPGCIVYYEQCGNGSDDDYDGQTDCNDADCAGDYQCHPPREYSCSDGVDNDWDWMVDCADSECAGQPECTLSHEECSDTVDNDGDGLIDCEDFSDCACADIEICGLEGDEDGNGYSDCADKRCAHFPACAGFIHEICQDGVDNDGNGSLDCDDYWCKDEAVCIPTEQCTNGSDDDADGVTDCDDSDCSNDESCVPQQENCTNEVDDDGDGQIDADDSSCRGSEVIPAEGTPIASLDPIFGVRVPEGSPQLSSITESMWRLEAVSGHTAGQVFESVLIQIRDGVIEAYFGIENRGVFNKYLTAGTEYQLTFSVRGVDASGNEIIVAEGGSSRFTTPDVLISPLPNGVVLIRHDVVVESKVVPTPTPTEVPTATSVPIEYSCTDGADEDGDGFTDCADSDCSGTQACYSCVSTGPESCGNSTDDDCDGAVDCSDSECIDALECEGYVPPVATPDSNWVTPGGPTPTPRPLPPVPTVTNIQDKGLVSITCGDKTFDANIVLPVGGQSDQLSLLLYEEYFKGEKDPKTGAIVGVPYYREIQAETFSTFPVTPVQLKFGSGSGNHRLELVNYVGSRTYQTIVTFEAKESCAATPTPTEEPEEPTATPEPTDTPEPPPSPTPTRKPDPPIVDDTGKDPCDDVDTSTGGSPAGGDNQEFQSVSPSEEQKLPNGANQFNLPVVRLGSDSGPSRSTPEPKPVTDKGSPKLSTAEQQNLPTEPGPTEFNSRETEAEVMKDPELVSAEQKTREALDAVYAAEEKLESGAGTQADVDQARADYDAARAEFESKLSSAINQLNPSSHPERDVAQSTILGAVAYHSGPSSRPDVQVVPVTGSNPTTNEPGSSDLRPSDTVLASLRAAQGRVNTAIARASINTAGAQRNFENSVRNAHNISLLGELLGLGADALTQLEVDRDHLARMRAEEARLREQQRDLQRAEAEIAAMYEKAAQLERDGYEDAADLVRSQAADLAQRASDQTISSLNPDAAREYREALEGLNERLDRTMSLVNAGAVTASIVRESAHVAGVGVGFALAGPAGGAVVNQGLRMVEGATEELTSVALGDKTYEEAHDSFMERSRGALVESSITLIAGAAGSKLNKVVGAMSGPVAAKAVDVVGSGLVQAGATSVQVAVEFAEAKSDFESQNPTLTGEERERAYRDFMEQRGLSLEQVSRRLGISLGVGSAARVLGSLARKAGDEVEEFSGELGEQVGHGQPLTPETLVAAAVGSHATRRGVESSTSNPTSGTTPPQNAPPHVQAAYDRVQQTKSDYEAAQASGQNVEAAEAAYKSAISHDNAVRQDYADQPVVKPTTVVEKARNDLLNRLNEAPTVDVISVSDRGSRDPVLPNGTRVAATTGYRDVTFRDADGQTQQGVAFRGDSGKTEMGALLHMYDRLNVPGNEKLKALLPQFKGKFEKDGVTYLVFEKLSGDKPLSTFDQLPAAAQTQLTELLKPEFLESVRNTGLNQSRIFEPDYIFEQPDGTVRMGIPFRAFDFAAELQKMFTVDSGQLLGTTPKVPEDPTFDPNQSFDPLEPAGVIQTSYEIDDRHMRLYSVGSDWLSLRAELDAASVRGTESELLNDRAFVDRWAAAEAEMEANLTALGVRVERRQLDGRTVLALYGGGGSPLGKAIANAHRAWQGEFKGASDSTSQPNSSSVPPPEGQALQIIIDPLGSLVRNTGGSYDTKTRILSIAPDELGDGRTVPGTLVHELTHAFKHRRELQAAQLRAEGRFEDAERLSPPTLGAIVSSTDRRDRLRLLMPWKRTGYEDFQSIDESTATIKEAQRSLDTVKELKGSDSNSKAQVNHWVDALSQLERGANLIKRTRTALAGMRERLKSSRVLDFDDTGAAVHSSDVARGEGTVSQTTILRFIKHPSGTIYAQVKHYDGIIDSHGYDESRIPLLAARDNLPESLAENVKLLERQLDRLFADLDRQGAQIERLTEQARALREPDWRDPRDTPFPKYDSIAQIPADRVTAIQRLGLTLDTPIFVGLDKWDAQRLEPSSDTGKVSASLDGREWGYFIPENPEHFRSEQDPNGRVAAQFAGSYGRFFTTDATMARSQAREGGVVVSITVGDAIRQGLSVGRSEAYGTPGDTGAVFVYGNPGEGRNSLDVSIEASAGRNTTTGSEDSSLIPFDPATLDTPDSALNFRPNSPYFNELGQWVGRGDVRSAADMNTAVRRVYTDRPAMASEFSRMRSPPKLFHGSTSASLLMYMDSQSRQGQLRPSGAIEASNGAVFSGEIVFGKSTSDIAVVDITDIETAVGYSRPGAWSPEAARERIRQAQTVYDRNRQAARDGGYLEGFERSIGANMSLNAIATETLRLAAWDKLTAREKELVTNQFPVIYGIDTERSGALSFPMFSDIRNELRLEGGTTGDEIRAIFVPRERIPLVRSMVGENGPRVLDIDILNANSALNGATTGGNG